MAAWSRQALLAVACFGCTQPTEGGTGGADAAIGADTSTADSAPQAPVDTELSDDVVSDVGDGTSEDPVGLPHVHTVDAAAAARGARVFFEDWPGTGIIPRLALRHLYLAWSDDLIAFYGFYTDDNKYWAAFRERYGLNESPTPNDDLPLGFRKVGDGSVASVTCLVCHSGRAPDGTVLIGLANNRLDLQGLYDDLQKLPAAFEALKAKSLPEPYKTIIASIPVPPAAPPMPGMTDRTGAAGATDAMGLGINFGALALGKDPEADGIHVRFGFQSPNSWWTIAFKLRRYWDGSVPFGGHRTMMSTLLGLGLDFSQLAALDATFADIEQYFLTLEPPRWSFEVPAAASVAQGRTVFTEHCAECHGTYEGPGATYPNRVIPLAEIGTDPMRSENFGEKEEALANELTQDPNHKMERTGGYIAPPLAGAWATAPYFHNGSVPDLWSVLQSTARPARWRRTANGPEGYDLVKMGWKHDVVAGPANPDAPPKDTEGRRVVETSHPGMSNTGHLFGDLLTDDERTAVLDYLKTL